MSSRELWSIYDITNICNCKNLQWIALFKKEIIERFKETIENIKLPIKIQKLPTYVTNFVIVGDLIREAVAHEIALKISESCYLPVRSFGQEQFLHGPKVTIDKQTSILAFTLLQNHERKVY